MKILYLNHNVTWNGGTFFRALALARELTRAGHDVTLVTISPHRRLRVERSTTDGVQLIEAPDLFWGRGRTGWDPWDVFQRVIAIHGDRHWDVVHSFDCRPVAILPALWARHRARQAVLVTDWADWWGRGGTQVDRGGRFLRPIWPIETFFEEHFRTSAVGTTVISTALRDRAIALGISADRVRLLPAGCDPPNVGDRGAARARLGLHAAERIVLYLGRLNRLDGLLLFDCARQLLAGRPDCRLVLAGPEADVPADLAVHARFTRAGFLRGSALSDYVAACDLSIVPLGDTLASRARWPSKVNLFLSAGRAVVMTRVGDLAERLEGAHAAVVTDPNASALVTAVHRVIDDPGYRVDLEQAGTALAAGELAWSRIASDVDAWYQSLR